MLSPPNPENESERLASLRRMHLLSSPAEEVFDCITRTACKATGTPVALITLVDAERQWFKSRIGLDASETCRGLSFCGHAILEDEVFVIPDALADKRFADNPLVLGPPFVRSYAGMPLKNAEGHRIGTLCVIDHVPHTFEADSLEAIRDLARLAEMAFEHRRLGESQMQILAELDDARRDALMCPLTQVWNRRGFDALYEREAAKCAREGIPLALAAIDIDCFKVINDTHGHGVGDLVIRQMADILRGSSRSYDVIARVGGEEFLVLMRGMRPEDLKRVGSKFLQSARTGGRIPVNADANEPKNFTISLGLVSIASHVAPKARTLALSRADAALYAAKRDGRDRFVIAQPVDALVPEGMTSG